MTPQTAAGRDLIRWLDDSPGRVGYSNTVMEHISDAILAIETEASAEGWNRYADSLKAIGAEAAPAGGLRELLDQSVNVLYGMRNFILHRSTCDFARGITGIEIENVPCSCGFDNVEAAYQSLIEQLLAALAASPSAGLDVERLARALVATDKVIVDNDLGIVTDTGDIEEVVAAYDQGDAE